MNRIIIGLFVFAFMSCKQETAAPVEEKALVVNEYELKLTAIQEKNAALETGTMAGQLTGNRLKLTGIVDVGPGNSVSVSAKMGGYIESINLMPGNIVAKGQRLATVQNPEFIKLQQDYLVAKAALDYAGKDLNRQKTLNKDKASSDKVLQQAQTEYATQQALVQSYARQLQNVNINPGSVRAGNIISVTGVYAPISGTVHQVNVKRGQFVSATDVLVEIMNANDIHLKLKVFEKDLSLLKPGQKFTAYSNNYPELKYEGNITQVDKALGEDRSAVALGQFRRKDKSLAPGLYMNAEVELGSIDAQTLHGESIVTWEGKQYVFVKTAPQTFVMTPVELGTKTGDIFQIRNADSLAGKTLVLKGAYTLLMALKNVSDE